jgi:chemotaxis signal transduction protein
LSAKGSVETWVIVEIRKQQFAVPALSVREIVAMPEITAIPGLGSEQRGVINLRGQILPLIDTRKQLGWQSVAEELGDFCGLMGQREQDHRNWLAELEKSVALRAEFRLARDPHKCAFGQWYYAYRSESPWITALLQRFEEPHNQVHALASSIDHLMKIGEHDRALRLIESARNGVLQRMISLFQQLKELMGNTVRELALVITAAHATFAVSIDHVVAVEKISADLIKEVPTDSVSPGRGLVRRAVQRGATGALAMVLEPAVLNRRREIEGDR